MWRSRSFWWLLALVVSAGSVSAQIITTVAAGAAFTFPNPPLRAINAPLGQISGLAVDGRGNVYVADPGNSIIERFIPGGQMTVVAGNGIPGFSGDGGPATSASLNQPQGVAVDLAGNIYIADLSNSRIRKVSGGTITTVAGGGTSGDGGLATSASLNSPVAVAVDSAGNIYIADAAGNRIREVSAGIITTVAGNGVAGF
jgi:hypothetical protein